MNIKIKYILYNKKFPNISSSLYNNLYNLSSNLNIFLIFCQLKVKIEENCDQIWLIISKIGVCNVLYIYIYDIKSRIDTSWYDIIFLNMTCHTCFMS